ncbi:MAG: PA2169 family four-helix-bundle protein [Phycisphaerales bacterium]|nr:PA2169 family four-helix-bundle protein [Phycisphaerales bacterium]
MKTLCSLREETTERLNELVHMNLDAAGGFANAAELVDDEPVARAFRDCARQRREMAEALQRVVNRAGDDDHAKGNGHLRACASTWWSRIRGPVRHGDVPALLRGAERRERAIKTRYEDTVRSYAGSAVRGLLLEQLRAVSRTCDRIRALRDARTHSEI